MKKSKIGISIALAAVFAATPLAMAGCSGDRYDEIYFPAQNTSYVVTSQGGITVSYGNYVYFVNGTRGYDDPNGNSNVWGEVSKGALYRAELNGAPDNTLDGLNRFKPILDESGLEFKYTKTKDYFGDEINVVNTTRIAPKTVGTRSYERGGIFIYDNYAYFASPNNEKNKTGTVQSNSTDFFMMPLGGGKPVKVYTTTEKVDTSASEYAFYKYGGAVYLVVKENSSIASVRINVGKAEADEPVFFHVGASQVYFPVRDTYYAGIDNNTVEDFIYFVRPARNSDSQTAGNVIEAMRPNGAENFVVSSTGISEEIIAVRDGMVFYKTQESGKYYVMYTNLHDTLCDRSPSYKRAQDAKPEEERNSHISGRFEKEIESSASPYPFRVDKKSNEVFFVLSSDSGTSLYQNDVNKPLVGKICSDGGTVKFVENNYLYFSGSSSNYFRAPLFAHMEKYGSSQEIATSTASAGISCDYAAGYFVYFAEADQWAKDYAIFKKVDGNEGMEKQFIGQRIGSDIPSQSQIDEVKNNRKPS